MQEQGPLGNAGVHFEESRTGRYVPRAIFADADLAGLELARQAKWFAPHVAYTMAKFGMSLCVLGMSEEFRPDGIAVNALWPRTTIATAAVQNIVGGDSMIRRSRKPEIMADACYAIVTKPSRECTGNYFVDEDLLREEGIEDFTGYAVDPSAELFPDFFV